jgi:hypothetical protein
MQPVVRADAFDQHLPFATGFGLTDAWTKFFEKQGNTPIPAWFHSLKASLANFSDVSAAIDASSASADGAVAAAGTSGVGASGAGQALFSNPSYSMIPVATARFNELARPCMGKRTIS